jgi:hypothetical protein
MLKPKKLSLSEIWKLYLLLHKGLKDRERCEVFIDEVEQILVSSPPGTLFECLAILYDNKFEDKDVEGKELIILFINGLVTNSFYEFADFVKAFSNDSS